MNQDQDDVIAFIRDHIGSVYALELLLLIRRTPGKVWRTADLVRELRSSGTAVTGGLGRLSRAGFVSENQPGCYVFAPKSPDQERLAADIDNAYSSMPISVVKAIVGAPDDRLRVFSDAFKLKE